MKITWLKRLCATVLALLLALSMATGVTEDAAEVYAVGEYELPEEIEEFDLTASEEVDLVQPEMTAVAAPEAAEDIAETVKPKSAVPDKAEVKKGVPTALTLGVKETYALNTKKLGKKLTFESSNKKVATVDKKGVITAVKKGTATVTCYSNKKKVAACKVTVVAAPKKVTLNKSKVTIGAGESLTLKTTITKGSQATLKWSSKDMKIATVSGSGKITGKKAGTTTITVKAQNGVKAKATVTVKKAPKKIELDKTKLTLKVGKSKTLKVTLPKKTASYKLTWKSSDKSVATVTNKGVVTAIGPGTAKITVETFNGQKATCKVMVQWNAEPTGDFMIQDGIVVGYTGSGGDVVIPGKDAHSKTVYGIAPHAFAGNGKITSIVIPSGFTQIGEYAFEGCSALTAVNYPNSISEFGAGVFKNCPKLKTLSVTG